jgi:hypothetical protein
MIDQRVVFKKNINDFLEVYKNRFFEINNYQVQKGKIGYQTELNNQNPKILLNMYIFILKLIAFTQSHLQENFQLCI